MRLTERVVPPVIRALIRHVPPRGRGIRLAHAWERRRPTSRVLRSRERSGMRLRCDLRDELSKVLYYRGVADHAVAAFMRRWLRPGDLYVDVGAHIGSTVSIAAEEVGPRGRIIALEPNPVTYELLAAAVRELETPAIEALQIAAGARDGNATVRPGPGADALSGAFVAEASAGDDGSASVRPLDGVLSGDPVRLLKIDAEGYEPEVLRGAERLLRERCCDALLVEINPQALERADSSPEEVVSLLGRAGYFPHRLLADGRPARVDRVAVDAAWVDIAFLPHRGDDVDVSVLVPTVGLANRSRRAPSDLSTALSESGLRAEMIVVVDGASDAEPDQGLPGGSGTRVVTHRGRHGAAAARNTAARAARGAWLLFCDDDVELRADGLVELWERRDPEACIVPIVRGIDGSIHNSVAVAWRRGDLKILYENRPRASVGMPLGACFLLRDELFAAAGGFDEQYFPNYYEDTDFGLALWRAGSRVRMVPSVEAIHYEQGGDRSGASRRRIEDLVYEHRWMFCWLALSGWRRATALGLGLPRTALESVRKGTLRPLLGYVRAVRRVPRLRRRSVVAAPGSMSDTTLFRRLKAAGAYESHAKRGP